MVHAVHGGLQHTYSSIAYVKQEVIDQFLALNPESDIESFYEELIVLRNDTILAFLSHAADRLFGFHAEHVVGIEEWEKVCFRLGVLLEFANRNEISFNSKVLYTLIYHHMLGEKGKERVFEIIRSHPQVYASLESYSQIRDKPLFREVVNQLQFVS